MSSPHGATWRSGYATVCKTVYTSSILVVASNHFKYLGNVPKFAATGLPPARQQICSQSVLRTFAEARLHDIGGASIGVSE